MRPTALTSLLCAALLSAAAAPALPADPPRFASHPPTRPLPAPSQRPRSAGPAFFVDPVRGDDKAAGTEAAPWRTIQHAAAQLKPGDTLYLRGGHYFEHVSVAQSGTPDRPITIRSFPGELAVINGGIREFFDHPQAAWIPNPNGVAGEFISTAPYPNLGGSPGGPNLFGNFGDSLLPLMGYRYLADLRDSSMVWDVTEKVGDSEGVYCGPGLFYDVESGRIHLRLAHTDLKALGDDNYRGETDPRKLPLIIAGLNAGPALSLDGVRHIRLQDFAVCGSSSATVDLADCQDVVCDGLSVYGGRTAFHVSGTAGLRLYHTACRGLAAPWTFRGHLKYRSAEARIFSASGWTPAARENRDFELAYSEFTDSVDGVFIGNVRNVHFHHNLLDNVSDDGLFLTATTAYDGVTHGGEHYIYQNLLSRCLSTFAFGVGHGRQKMTPRGRQTGAGVWIFRNVFDLRRPVHYHLPAPDDDAVTSYGRVSGEHGGPAHEPMTIYHNTIVETSPLRREYYLSDLASHMKAGVQRKLFNNIAVQMKGGPGRRLPNVIPPLDPTPQAPAPANPVDDPLADLLDDPKPAAKPSTITGNLKPDDLKKPNAAPKSEPPLPFDLQADGNLHWSYEQPPNPQTFLAAFRDSDERERSRRWYPPGWANSDVIADPQFTRFHGDWREPIDLRLNPSSPAINAGVPLPADWPDPLRRHDSGAPDLGALPAGAEPCRVGVRGRLTIFGQPAASSEPPDLAPIPFPAPPADFAPPRKPAAIVQGYPAFDSPFIRFALGRRGVPCEVFDRVWLDPRDYPHYSLVVIVGDLARAKMEPRAYSAADVEHVENYLQSGGVLLILRDGRQAFGSPDGGNLLRRIIGVNPPLRDARPTFRAADHPWLRHLDPQRDRAWLQPRTAVALPRSEGAAIIATPDQRHAALLHAPQGDGALIYLGWNLSEFEKREEQPATIEDERHFEEQIQLLKNIVEGVYTKQ